MTVDIDRDQIEESNFKYFDNGERNVSKQKLVERDVVMNHC